MNLNLKKLPLKALVFSIVFSLLPILVEVSPIEYSGISLQAADDDKKKKKRRRTKLPSKKATKILQQLQPLIEGELWEEMLLVLAPIADRNSKFTSTDRAKMYFYQGYIYFSIEKYLIPIWLKTYKIFGYETNLKFYDIGTKDRYISYINIYKK